MKTVYLPARPKTGDGPRYILEPCDPSEQKFLSILRDALLAVPGSRLRMVGTEDDDVNKAGMPARPVLRMEVTIEGADGGCPGIYVPAEVDKLDPHREVHTSEHASPTSGFIEVATGENRNRKSTVRIQKRP